MTVLDIKVSNYAEKLHASFHFADNNCDLTWFLWQSGLAGTDKCVKLPHARATGRGHNVCLDTISLI